jgi:hypothetical protein
MVDSRTKPITPRMFGQGAYLPENNQDYWELRQDPEYYNKLGEAALDASTVLPMTGAAVGAARYLPQAVRSLKIGDLGVDAAVALRRAEEAWLPKILQREWVQGGRSAGGQYLPQRLAYSTPQKVGALATGAAAANSMTGDNTDLYRYSRRSDYGDENAVPNPAAARATFAPDERSFLSPEDMAQYKAAQARRAVTSTPTTPVTPQGGAAAAAPAAAPARGVQYQSNSRPVTTYEMPEGQGMGPGRGTVHVNWGDNENNADFFRADKAMRQAQAMGQDVTGYAHGGHVDRAMRMAHQNAAPCHHGIINMAVGGRTDHIPMNVLEGSYVLPADIVSGLGEGNTLAGTKIVDQMFSTGPMGTKIPNFRANPRFPAAPPHTYQTEAQSPKTAAGGGRISRKPVPIIAAGGEYVVHPDVVERLGSGDMDKGHQYLDNFVKYVRAETAKTLRNLPGPRKD